MAYDWPSKLHLICYLLIFPLPIRIFSELEIQANFLWATAEIMKFMKCFMNVLVFLWRKLFNLLFYQTPTWKLPSPHFWKLLQKTYEKLENEWKPAFSCSMVSALAEKFKLENILLQREKSKKYSFLHQKNIYKFLWYIVGAASSKLKKQKKTSVS